MVSQFGRAERIPRRSLDLLLWSTRTRPEVNRRDYSGEGVVAFLRADQLEDEARAIAERFSGRSNPRAGEPSSGTADLG